MQTDRAHSITITITSLLLAGMALCSCGPSNEEEKAAREQSLIRINQTTTAAAASFNTILAMERQFSNATRSIQRSSLDMFWMALQSTTRDLERMGKMLAENPGLIPEAKNYWNGRIQENLSTIESSGMLVRADSPVTSKLGEVYGEDRVKNEIKRLFESTHAIQDLLDISWTPYTPADSAAPTAP